MVVHDDERRAVGQTPILVGTRAIELDCASEQTGARRNDHSMRSAPYAIDDLQSALTECGLRERICKFQQHKFRDNQRASLRGKNLLPANSGVMPTVARIHQREKICGVDKQCCPRDHAIIPQRLLDARIRGVDQPDR